jgi:DNA adenine methylase
MEKKITETHVISGYPVVSPLRYPGGKSRALKTLIPLIPDFQEYREPMVGGGSVFLALKQNFPKRKFWINDKHRGVYLFWKLCQKSPQNLISEILRLKKKFRKGRRLYEYLKSEQHFTTGLQQAARFFILNRITFSGLIESGGYSEESYHKRFTKSSIDRINIASKHLQGVKITNLDYSKLLSAKGQNVAIFLDPPYYSKAHNRLYGKRGDLHKRFDHNRFVNKVELCKHKLLITYDNCSKIQELFSSEEGCRMWKKSGWRLQYGTNNLSEKKAKIGEELIISNYEV